MKRPTGLKRRQFLATAAAGAAAGCTAGKSPWRFFTAAEAAVVEAAAECMIPRDQDPGARDAGVIHYIDRQLAGRFRKVQSDYRAGVVALDATARQAHGKAFAELAAAEQTAILAAMEKGQAPPEFWPRGLDRRFFGHLLDHTMQGFYGSPRHGGNRDYASWRMLGIPPIPVRGRLHYEVKG